MMPRGDGTGPMGLGPMSGRGAGYCNGYSVSGFANPALGFGFGRGMRRRFWATGIPGWAYFSGSPTAAPFMPINQDAGIDPAAEVRMLKSQIEMMEQSLTNAKERLNELQKNEK